MFWVAFRANGAELATATDDGTVWVHDVSDPDHPELYARLDAAAGALDALAYLGPDGPLAAAGSGRLVHLWDLRL